MTRLQLLGALREDDNLKRLPVLMVTGNAQHSQVKEAIELGVAGYLIKPLSAEVLGQKITQLAAVRPLLH